MVEKTSVPNACYNLARKRVSEEDRSDGRDRCTQLCGKMSWRHKLLLESETLFLCVLAALSEQQADTCPRQLVSLHK